MVRSLVGKHAQYYEAILQLRDVTPEVIKFAHKEMQRAGLGVSNIVKVRTGFDYYTIDNDLTRKLGKRLQTHFGGQLEITATLHTKKKNKDLYRLTVLFRPTLFSKDDIVIFNGEEYRVLSVRNGIFLQQHQTGKKLHLRLRDLRQIRKR